eukprot:299053-Rhodomonas_salina.4
MSVGVGSMASEAPVSSGMQSVTLAALGGGWLSRRLSAPPAGRLSPSSSAEPEAAATEPSAPPSVARRDSNAAIDLQGSC